MQTNNMPKVIEAIYENGVFKPLQKVELREGEKVKVIVDRGLTQLFGMFRHRRKTDLDEDMDLMITERA
ncbi:hypothetical protein AFULGI_00003060 [Archaeoglobus fulgidus DSM 8774]|uniref:Antitoxin n=3 Tax=Archaeoglobus fulgidus TaxID=2234 RepID=A0A075WC69_ARCFL|nr:hypothetical protein AFULGI_00003060 [Archaeoglobus fulgidus DSM 8774]KUK05340.1 MAG: Putative antitoxin [Archaeoglobus fulgidus]